MHVTTACQAALTVGVGAILVLLFHFPIKLFVEELRGLSGIAKTRPRNERGVPPTVIGGVERLLAYGLFLFGVEGAGAIMAVWIGAKLAASWQRLTVGGHDDERGRQYRAGTMVALIGGTLSVVSAAVVGWVVRQVVFG